MVKLPTPNYLGLVLKMQEKDFEFSVPTSHEQSLFLVDLEMELRLFSLIYTHTYTYLHTLRLCSSKMSPASECTVNLLE